MTSEVRVRYAPSPTGYLHIGNARTALFNYLYAKHNDGTFVIRIEDTDAKRNVEGGEQSQLDYLQWLGIEWDEGAGRGGDYGPYHQMQRLHIYEQYTEELLEKGLAYKCYMTTEELEEEREAQKARGEVPKYSGAHSNLTKQEEEQFEAEGRVPSIRLRVPENKTYTFTDIVRGDISFESSDFGDWVIVKQNGTPTYNFAVAIDDYLMKISHVLRGEEHISNTPKQMMVYESFGWTPPKFGHMTLILNEERKKLSKRDQHILQFISQYHERGYEPEALFNFITLLGWSPVGEEEIFSKSQLIDIFDENRLSTSPAVFDPAKLKWMNNQYIKELSFDEVLELTIPHLEKTGRISKERTADEQKWTEELIRLYQPQLNYGAEITELTELFFRETIDYDEEATEVLSGEQVPEVLEAFKRNLDQLEEFTPENIKPQMKAVQKETGHKGKKLFMPIRVATTGQTHGPELPDAIHLLGYDTVSARLQKALEQLQ